MQRPAAGHPAFIRTDSVFTIAGVRGIGIRYDEIDGDRTVERISAGAASRSAGYDTASWSADATGFATLDDDPSDAASADVYGALFGGVFDPPPVLACLPLRDGAPVVRMTFAGMPAPFEIVLDPKTARVARFIDRSSGEETTTTFADYRTVARIESPWKITVADRTGVTVQTVTARTGLATVPDDVFRRPPRPRDTHLAGVTVVPVAAAEDGIVVPVTVNGRPLRLVLDSGSGNFLTPDVARRVGLPTVPFGRSGGIGPRVVDERIGLAKRLAVGAALLDDQPFSVLSYDTDEDGVLGCEFLERFAVRIDYERNELAAARTVAELAPRGTAIPIRFSGCVPETDGSVDGLRGAISIDTGNAWSLDIMGPAVRANDLIAKYHAAATAPAETGVGIGGATYARPATARRVCLATVCADGVALTLSEDTLGAYADTTLLGNLGNAFLRRYASVTFDYAGHRMWLEPRRPRSAGR